MPPAQQGEFHSLGDQLLADTGDGPQAGTQRRDDLLIGVFLAVAIIGQQQDAGVGQFAGRGLAAGHQLLQFRPLLRRQRDSILVHRGRPVLEVRRLAVEPQDTAPTCQMKMDDPLVLCHSLILG